ncbi:retroviral-like aspartic protease family protein [Microcoleus sp. bin38.metabat.b11b12b14.051]|uniref:retroviral-like aspartic protease family protein n=1 Tax=Microcoleus sp. bin38.metabat.b11b12b14.051 TaxID=2742709 RepID=UPI0025DC644E|nr:retroviral-like aspartic protease family protein [Microcoleus sp. bin38.metabat.b11b12b14.051]
MQSTTKNLIGKVITTLAIQNLIDQADAERGMIPVEQIRYVTLENVLVDTGATTLCLPKDVIARLGLKILKQVVVETATGISEARIFQDAKISLCGREGTFECLELPEGKTPLLGVIPMEALGIEVDLKHQSLKVLPDGPTETYLTIL